MRSASDASLCSSKWASRASSNPFNASSVAATCVENGLETTGQCTTQDADGKENCSPSSGCNLDHECVTGRLKTRPSLVKDNPFPFSLSAGTLTPSLLLGKRLSRADVCSPATHKALDMSEEDQETNLNHLKRYRRDSFTVANVRTHEETRALELDDVILDVLEDQEQNEVVGCDTMTIFVDDLDHVGQLHFGAVALGERKTRRLTLKNASESSSARVKYEGCALVHEEHGPLTTSGARTKTRFKCDLHLGVIDALKSVTLRVTFEPLPADVERQVAAMLKFTVNDKFTLQCRLVGTGTPCVVQLSG